MFRKILAIIILFSFAGCGDADQGTPQNTAAGPPPSNREIYYSACSLILESLDQIKDEAISTAASKGVSLSDKGADEVVLNIVIDLPQQVVKAYGKKTASTDAAQNITILEATLSALVQEDLEGKTARYYLAADALYNARATSSAVFAYNARKALGKEYDYVSYDYYHSLPLMEQVKELMAAQLDAARGLGYFDETSLEKYMDLLGSENMEIHRDPENKPMAFENAIALQSAADTEQDAATLTYHDYLYGRFLNGDLDAANYSQLSSGDSIKTVPMAAGVVNDVTLVNQQVTPQYKLITYSDACFHAGGGYFVTDSISDVAPNDSSGYVPSMATVNFNSGIEDEIILIYNGVMMAFSYNETAAKYELLGHVQLPQVTPNNNSLVATSVAAVCNEDRKFVTVLVALSQNDISVGSWGSISSPGFWGTVYRYDYNIKSKQFEKQDSYDEFKSFVEGGESFFEYAEWLSVHTQKSDNPISQPDQIMVNVGEVTSEGYYGSRIYLYNENDKLENLENTTCVADKEISNLSDTTLISAFTNSDYYKTLYTGSFKTAFVLDSVTTIQILPDIITIADVPPCSDAYSCQLLFDSSSSSGSEKTNGVSNGWTATTTVSMEESFFDIAKVSESYANAVGYSASSSVAKGTSVTTGLSLGTSSQKAHWYSSDPTGSVYYSQYTLNQYSLKITQSPEAAMVGTTLTYFGWLNVGATYTDSFEDYKKLTKIDLNSVTGHTPGHPGSYENNKLSDPNNTDVFKYYERNGTCPIPTNADPNTNDEYCYLEVSQQESKSESETDTASQTFTVGGGETISMDVIMKFSVNFSESEQTTTSSSHGITQSFSSNNRLTFIYPQNAGLYFAKNNCSVSPVIAIYTLTNTNITQSLPTAYLSTTDEKMSPKDVFTVGTVAMVCSDN